MWNVSSSLADTLFAWANVALIIGAALVLVGTIASIKTAAVRERFADLRISDNERETKRAIADLNAAKSETAKAQLETERLKKELGWRDVTPSQAQQLVTRLHGKSIQVVFDWGMGDAEASYFANRLAQVFLMAGLQVMGGGPIGQLGAEMHGVSIAGWRPNDVKSLADALIEVGLGPVEQTIVPPPATPQSAGQYNNIFVGYRPAPKIDVVP